MWGAAPHLTPPALRAATLGVVFVFASVGQAANPAGSERASTGALPGGIVAFEVEAASATHLTHGRLRALKRLHVNTLVIRPGVLHSAQEIRVRALAQRVGVAVYTPLIVGSKGATVQATAERCHIQKTRTPAARCVVLAPSASAVWTLARTRVVDVILQRVPETPGVGRPFGGGSWLLAFGPSAQEALILGLPTSLEWTHYRTTTLAWLTSVDSVPPASPVNLRSAAISASKLKLTWSGQQKRPAVRFGIYLDGRFVDQSKTPEAVVSAACGTHHLVAVDAADDAGNRSPKVWLRVRTSVCLESPMAAGPRPTVPSTPPGAKPAESTPTPGDNPPAAPSSVPVAPDPAEHVVANLWVDPSADDAKCARSPSRRTYTAVGGSACASLSKASTLAQAGDVILVRPGHYAWTQIIQKTDVTIQGELGSRPVFAGLEVLKGSRVTVRNVKVTTIAQMRLGSGTIFDDIDVENGGFAVIGEAGGTIQNSYVHDTPATTTGTCQSGVYANLYNITPQVFTTHLTIHKLRIERQMCDGMTLLNVKGALVEDVTMRDLWPKGDPAASHLWLHVDAVQLLSSSDVTIRRLDARRTWHGILITDTVPRDGADADNRAITVENSIVMTAGDPAYPGMTGGYAFNGPPGQNSVIVNNLFGSDLPNTYGVAVRGVSTFTADPPSNPGANSAGSVFQNNIVYGRMNYEGGQFGGTEDYNVTSHANFNCSWCGTHTILAPLVFTGDYELPAGSKAANSANPVYAPPLDMLGWARVGTADRGPKERH